MAFISAFHFSLHSCGRRDAGGWAVGEGGGWRFGPTCKHLLCVHPLPGQAVQPKPDPEALEGDSVTIAACMGNCQNWEGVP